VAFTKTLVIPSIARDLVLPCSDRHSSRRCKLVSMPYPRSAGTKSFFRSVRMPPARIPRALPRRPQRRRRPRQPGPAGYGVVIQDESGKKVAHLSEYLGHQTNNFAEYQALSPPRIRPPARPKALKLISDSELLVRQIKASTSQKPTLQDLHGRAKELIAQLECSPSATPFANTTPKPTAWPISHGQRHGAKCGPGAHARDCRRR